MKICSGHEKVTAAPFIAVLASQREARRAAGGAADQVRAIDRSQDWPDA